jgi:hypothetical protein
MVLLVTMNKTLTILRGRCHSETIQVIRSVKYVRRTTLLCGVSAVGCTRCTPLRRERTPLPTLPTKAHVLCFELMVKSSKRGGGGGRNAGVAVAAGPLRSVLLISQQQS